MTVAKHRLGIRFWPSLPQQSKAKKPTEVFFFGRLNIGWLEFLTARLGDADSSHLFKLLKHFASAADDRSEGIGGTNEAQPGLKAKALR